MLFNDFRGHYRVFHPSRGVFFLLAQSDLNYPSTISLASQAITFPPKQPFWELISWLKKGQTFLFPTTWPLSLKSWSSFYIRPPLSPTLSQLFTPSMDIFILRTLDVWATVCWKRYLHCPPVVEMDFEWWVAIETAFAVFQRDARVGGKTLQLPLANAHLCQKPKWDITSAETD